jgi:prepilin-type N-terminal cleavage/methylation domain-containing protein
MTNRRGFTLIETLIVIVVAGLMMAVGFPRLRQAMISTNLRSARNTAAALHAQARAVAVDRGRTSELRVSGNRAVVVTKFPVPVGGSTHDTVGAVHDLYSEYGATLTLSGPIGFDPRGVGTNTSTETMVLTKSGKSASVIVLPFGRLQLP